MGRIGKYIVILALLLLAGFLAAQHFGSKLARQKLDQAIARVSDKVNVTYTDANLDLLGLNLVVDNVGLRFPDEKYLSIDRLVVQDMDFRHGSRPRDMVVSFYGITVNVNHVNFGPDFEDIQNLGYYTINADMHLAYKWDPDLRTFNLDDFRLDIQDVGNISLNLALENVDLDKLRQKQFEDLVIKSLDMAYSDQSLIKKLTIIAAEDEQEFMDFIVGGLRYDAEAARREFDQNTAHSLTELISFLERPQRFDLDMHLLQPVAVRSILTTKKISYIRQLFYINFQTTG